MWGRLQVDPLFYQNIHFMRTVAEHLEVRQMRVEIECPDTRQKIESIRLGINLDGGGRPVLHFRRSEAKSIGHGNTQIPKQRSGKAAKALLSRNSEISMVVELHFLRRQDLVTGNAIDVADVMMRANE